MIGPQVTERKLRSGILVKDFSNPAGDLHYHNEFASLVLTPFSCRFASLPQFADSTQSFLYPFSLPHKRLLQTSGAIRQNCPGLTITQQ